MSNIKTGMVPMEITPDEGKAKFYMASKTIESSSTISEVIVGEVPLYAEITASNARGSHSLAKGSSKCNNITYSLWSIVDPHISRPCGTELSPDM